MSPHRKFIDLFKIQYIFFFHIKVDCYYEELLKKKTPFHENPKRMTWYSWCMYPLVLFFFPPSLPSFLSAFWSPYTCPRILCYAFLRLRVWLVASYKFLIRSPGRRASGKRKRGDTSYWFRHVAGATSNRVCWHHNVRGEKGRSWHPAFLLVLASAEAAPFQWI